MSRVAYGLGVVCKVGRLNRLCDGDGVGERDSVSLVEGAVKKAN